MLWCCQLHNSVNTDIGAPTYTCDLDLLDERWKTGKPSCWGQLDLKDETE